MEKKQLCRLEMWGVLFTFCAAVVLHFSYQFSDGAVWTILFGAVNESVWEHIKILALPYLFWAFIERCLVQVPLRRLIVAKTAGLYFIAAATALGYFAYTGIAGHSILFVDIFCSFLWIALAHWISCRLTQSTRQMEGYFTIASFALLLFIAMCLVFTVNPPHIKLFEDPVTGLYGLSSAVTDMSI